MKFFILGGLPGSGKSTYARELRQQERCFVVSPDMIRRALNSGMYPKNDEYEVIEPLVWQLATQSVAALLQQGHNVAIDATNLYKASRKRWIDLALSVAPDVDICIIWCTENWDSPELWIHERGHTEEEYRKIRKHLEAHVEPPTVEEANVITR
jgi:predicted kinase